MNHTYSITFSVQIKPGSKNESIRYSNQCFHIGVRAPAHEGKANEALCKLLSSTMNVPKSSIEILKGKKSKHKIVRIWGNKDLTLFIKKKIEEYESQI